MARNELAAANSSSGASSGKISFMGRIKELIHCADQEDKNIQPNNVVRGQKGYRQYQKAPENIGNEHDSLPVIPIYEDAGN